MVYMERLTRMEMERKFADDHLDPSALPPPPPPPILLCICIFLVAGGGGRAWIQDDILTVPGGCRESEQRVY